MTALLAAAANPTVNRTADTAGSIIDKVRAGRRAALASLNARQAQGGNVVSLYRDRIVPRRAVPEFHSVRKSMPVLVLTERVAA